MSNIFEKWDQNVDVEGMKKDIQSASENSGNREYKEVPLGSYEVSVEKMELKASKKGDPMFSAWFNIVEGEYKNNKIFMNQVLNQGFQFHIVNELLRKLTEQCLDAPEIEFDGFANYANLIMDVHELIDGNFEYVLKYGQTEKGFNTFEIKEVFILD